MQNSSLILIRRLLLFFMISLFLSGATAIPIDVELNGLLHLISPGNALHTWLNKVFVAYSNVKSAAPFLLYGYDWLAFAHFILAILFIGPYKDPVRNIWVIEFGLIACVLVLPLACIAGYFRDIPLGWQLIDCSFGVVGFVPLFICYLKTKQLARETSHETLL